MTQGMLSLQRKMTNKRFVKLSWRLLEAKATYYCTDSELMADSEYDTLEKKYLKLCKILKQPNTVQSMVGFDKSRPSCNLVLEKMRGNQ